MFPTQQLNRIFRELQARRLNWYSIRGIKRKIGLEVRFIDDTGNHITNVDLIRTLFLDAINHIRRFLPKIRYIQREKNRVFFVLINEEDIREFRQYLEIHLPAWDLRSIPLNPPSIRFKPKQLGKRLHQSYRSLN
uniref:Uncharacterized protein n=1 Tax=Tetranychus urticae TaxID=32264 RepID=T1K5W5_TETUR